MDKTNIIAKLKMGRCMFCRTKTLRKDLCYCCKVDCPIFDICEGCMKIHKKGHIKEETPMGDDVIDLLYSLNNNNLSTANGNNSGLF